MKKVQPLSAKIGEIAFRQKLVKQHLGKNQSFLEEADHKEILSILKERVKKTRKIFLNLKQTGVRLSPFLEIGAEKGQRAMVLTNDFKAEGFALDLSLESLASAKPFSSLLGFSRLPNLVCADAYQLPFAENSFPFVFCFETLHHFPDPKPIIEEIHRVLAPGGIFYFAEEPIKQTLNLNLWRRGTHLSSAERLLKKVGLLPFVSRIGKTEVKHGALEEEFSFSTWRKALSVFEQVETEVRPVFFGSTSPLRFKKNYWSRPNILTSLLIALQGGGIQGYGRKAGQLKKGFKTPVLVCPDCKVNLNHLSCPKCHRQFEDKNGVLMLLPENLQKYLYD